MDAKALQCYSRMARKEEKPKSVKNVCYIGEEHRARSECQRHSHETVESYACNWEA